MTSNFKWVVLVFSIASVGLSACGGSDGGGSTEDICDEKATSYDEQACEECHDKLFACYEKSICRSEGMAANLCGWSKCGAEIAAYDACEDLAWEQCERLEDFDAYLECRETAETACAGDRAVVNACGRSKCGAEISGLETCWVRECPGTSACYNVID